MAQAERMRKAYTPATAAEKWGVSTDTVYAMIHSGRLKAFRFGGHLYRIRPEEVERFECQEITPSNDSAANGPSSGETKEDGTDIRLERLIDHRPTPQPDPFGRSGRRGAASTR